MRSSLKSQSSKKARQSSSRRRRAHTVLQLEQLEDRNLLSVVPTGLEFPVNQFTAGDQVTTITSLTNANKQAVASDALGNSIAVWTSALQDGSGLGIFARMFDPFGNPLSAETQINSNPVGDQVLPVVAMSANGQAVIAWASDDGSGNGIFESHFNGAFWNAASLVNISNTLGEQTAPTVAMDADGDFVIAWQGQPGGPSSEIFARRYDATGAPQGGEFQINNVGIGDQTSPAVAMDAAGNFVVAWVSPDLDQTGIFARRYDQFGIAQGSQFRVNEFAANIQDEPAVAANAGGDYVIAWRSIGQEGIAGSSSIVARSFGSTGAPLSSELLVNTTTAGDQLFPAVDIDPIGDFVVTWTGPDGSGAGVFAQAFDALGQRAGAEFRINATTALDQYGSAVTIDDFGDVFFVWTSTNQDSPGGGGVFGRSYQFDDYPDTFYNAQSVFLSYPGFGSLGGSIEVAYDVDMFQFVAPETGMMSIEQSAPFWSALDSHLFVYDSAGFLIANNDNFNAVTNDSRVEFFVSAGETYFVRAAAHDPNALPGSTGDYQLYFSTLVDDFPNDFFNAHAIGLAPESVVGQFGTIEWSFDSDAFVFTSPGTGTMTIVHEWAGGEPLQSIMVVFDSSFRFVAAAGANVGFLGNVANFQVTQGQTFFIRVFSINNTTGSYFMLFDTLNVTVEEDDALLNALIGSDFDMFDVADVDIFADLSSLLRNSSRSETLVLTAPTQTTRDSGIRIDPGSALRNTKIDVSSTGSLEELEQGISRYEPIFSFTWDKSETVQGELVLEHATGVPVLLSGKDSLAGALADGEAHGPLAALSSLPDRHWALVPAFFSDGASSGNEPRNPDGSTPSENFMRGHDDFLRVSSAETAPGDSRFSQRQDADGQEDNGILSAAAPDEESRRAWWQPLTEAELDPSSWSMPTAGDAVAHAHLTVVSAICADAVQTCRQALAAGAFDPTAALASALVVAVGGETLRKAAKSKKRRTQ